MNRATLYIVLLAVACTVLGVALGVAIEKKHVQRNLPGIVRNQLLRHPKVAQELGRRAIFAQKARQRMMGAKIFQRLGQELDLTSEQKEQIKDIMESRREEIKQAGAEFKAQVEELREKGDAQIVEVLNPEQKEKFEQWRAAIKARQEQKPRYQRGIE